MLAFSGAGMPCHIASAEEKPLRLIWLVVPCQIEDLSCMETTVFDRVSDSECTTDVEAQSQLLLSTSRFPKTDEDEICSLIRSALP